MIWEGVIERVEVPVKIRDNGVEGGAWCCWRWRTCRLMAKTGQQMGSPPEIDNRRDIPRVQWTDVSSRFLSRGALSPLSHPLHNFICRIIQKFRRKVPGNKSLTDSYFLYKGINTPN